MPKTLFEGLLRRVWQPASFKRLWLRSIFGEDALTEDNEVVTLFKTVNEKVSLLENYVKSHHEYDVPAIIRVPAKADSAYGRWMNDALER